MAEKKKTDWHLVYSVVIMLILCALGNLSNIVISAFVLVLALPLILKPEYLLGLVLFTTVFDQYIIFSKGQSFSRFFVLFFLLGALIRFFPNLGKMKVDLRFGYFVVFFLMGLFLSFWGLEGRTSFPVTYLLNLILMAFMAYYTVEDSSTVMNQLWISAAIGSLYSLWILTRGGLDAFETGRISYLDGGLNANEAAMVLCVITVILFSRFFTAKKTYAFFNAILIGIAVVSLFLTGSRSSLLGVLAGVIVIILIWIKQSGHNLIKGIFACAVMATVFITIFFYMQEAFPVLMERFTVENVKEYGGSGRMDVWQAYFTHYFPDYWAFGIGFDPANIFYAVGKVSKEGHGSHNALVDILSSSGIFGLAIYLSFLGQVFHRIAKKIKENKHLLLVAGLLVGLLVNGIGENIVRGRFFWFAVGLAFVLSNSCVPKKCPENVKNK